MKTEEGEVGNRGGPADGGGFLLAGEVGFGPLLIEQGKRDALLANEIEGGRTADFLEGFTEKFFLPFSGGFGEEREELAFFGAASPDFGQSGHGVAADFFGGIGEEGEEPLADGLFEVGLEGVGKSSADGADESDLAQLFVGRGRLKKGNLLLPETQPGNGAEFPIEILGRAGLFFGHREASVWSGGNSSLDGEQEHGKVVRRKKVLSRTANVLGSMR